MSLDRVKNLIESFKILQILINQENRMKCNQIFEILKKILNV